MFASKTFTVVTLGEEFLTDVSGESMAVDFPGPGQMTLLEWNEAAQRFEIVGVLGVAPE